jgi:hypothetical protein
MQKHIFQNMVPDKEFYSMLLDGGLKDKAFLKVVFDSLLSLYPDSELVNKAVSIAVGLEEDSIIVSLFSY